MTKSIDGDSRWEHYHLTRGDSSAEFWQAHVNQVKRDVLVVTSRSFDPRTQLIPSMLREAGGEGKRDVVALAYDEPGSDAKLREAAEANITSIAMLTRSSGHLDLRTLQMKSADGRRIGPRLAGDLFPSGQELLGYTDIIIDVSGMPRSIFFPLTARLLFLVDNLVDQQKSKKNFFVMVAEDSGADAAIQARGIEELADYIPSFGGSFNREAQASLPRIWFPILGEKRRVQLERIYDLVKPNEVCPVLPSPAKNPRRSDNLVGEYREFLFGQLELDPRDFMVVAEDNPFEVYRRLRQAVLRYQEVLRDLGGCQVAFSVLSSKLTSLGALLTAYELKAFGIDIAVAHVDSQGYMVDPYVPQSEIVGLWIAGECYED